MNEMTETPSSQKGGIHPGYQLFMLALSLYALGSMAVLSAVQLNSEVEVVLSYTDWAVCALFFVDFLFSLRNSTDRVRYMLTWGWLDLLSCMPMLDAARFGRIARVARIVRVLRGFRASRILAGAVVARRAENALLAAVLATLLLLTFCSIAILLFEVAPESNIRSAEDAIWWSISTITTVGYGDRYPITSEGRVVASMLMLAGVGLFTTISGILAALFLSHGKRAQAEAAALREEVSALRRELALFARATQLNTQSLDPPTTSESSAEGKEWR